MYFAKKKILKHHSIGYMKSYLWTLVFKSWLNGREIMSAWRVRIKCTRWVVNELQHKFSLYDACIYLKSVPKSSTREIFGHCDCYCFHCQLLPQPWASLAWGDLLLLLPTSQHPTIPSNPPSASINVDPKQTMAERNVPSTQTGFGVKESVAQNEFMLCCVEGSTNGAWDSRRGRDGSEGEDWFLNLGLLIHQWLKALGTGLISIGIKLAVNKVVKNDQGATFEEMMMSS